jgi:hypothetical protein
MATPQLMAALLSGQLGNNPAGQQMAGAVQDQLTGPGSGSLDGPGGIGGLGGVASGNNLYMLAGMGVSELMRNLPKVFNGLMDLQTAKQESEAPPGALPTPSEPQPEGPVPGAGMPPGPMAGPPAMAGGAPPGGPPPLMMMLMRMLAARQAAQGAQLPGMPPPQGMIG